MAFLIVVMGVSGCGKSTLGRKLAEALGIAFVEGDDLHPPANVAKMAAGQSLNDTDRIPFLDTVAARLAEHRGKGCVVSCSALRRAYRDRLRAHVGQEIHFVLPLLSREALMERMQQRKGHFMPANLLDSQLATLELPSPEERVVIVEGEQSLDLQLAHVMDALSARAG
ncbi:MAG: gluconokinase [Sphingobium sp.]